MSQVEGSLKIGLTIFYLISLQLQGTHLPLKGEYFILSLKQFILIFSTHFTGIIIGA